MTRYEISFVCDDCADTYADQTRMVPDLDSAIAGAWLEGWRFFGGTKALLSYCPACAVRRFQTEHSQPVLLGQ